ncbi:MAG TPA: DNA polymerase III subunit alpha, partial [Rhodothermia bacterium]|nr:DNA polymerase III subunit alpha [Rhodothermia bacterium]
MPEFCHLHCHTHYSFLDGASRIDHLFAKAAEHGMPAVAITDHGNLHGIPEFTRAAEKYGLKAILGCEFYLCHSMEDRQDRTRFHQLLLAKNEAGYRNLIRLSSLSYTDGFYYKPRIDRAMLASHSEGLVASTCCLQGEVPQAILRRSEAEARALFEQYLEIFGEDYYIEIQDHGIADQRKVNEVLLRWSREYNVRLIATNDVHYVDQADSEPHDVLLCLQTGADLNDSRRMRFDNDQFFFKGKSEMQSALTTSIDPALVDAALDNTIEVAQKCDFSLSRADMLMPHYPLPPEFRGDMDAYLRHLVFERAKARYASLSQDVADRLDHELAIIKEMGFAGYFLIVQDFTTAARTLGVTVGPGRGSAAGSLVAFCLGITNIDPLKHDLLFERFLNPERISMPDIDIDFDDRGRGKVIDYVIEKYGRNSVSQIVTFGTMGARSAIRDVARVLGLPLPDADRIAKLIPEGPTPEDRTLAVAVEKVPELRDLLKHPDEKIRKLIQFARLLEGSARQTGVHAAGVIIAPGDVSEYVPVAVAKGKAGSGNTVISQYDGNAIERFGLLKMDFLGLKTLTILNDAVELIRQESDVEIDLDDLPENDEATLDLFRRAETVGIFQFESDGMREWLRKLRPTSFNDLVAMNALYRPGPMPLIPNYVDRKNGRESVEYPHPMLKDILEPTYGLPIYQEQVMQMAQTMAGYTLGGADLLRRAMSKKKPSEMDKQREIFVAGAGRNGVDERKANEIFDTMAKFAGYGFNKSHSAAYSVVAYQTAYLKAHYPAEFMAAVMTSELGDSSRLAVMIEELKRLRIRLLAPSINHSRAHFSIEKGCIRFGLLAIKGVGTAAVESIVEMRNEHGPFTNLFDFCRRINFRSVNKKTLECLILAGAMDEMEGKRSQLYEGLDSAIRYAQRLQVDEAAGQNSLFSSSGPAVALSKPSLPDVPAWPRSELLKKEREVVGFYVSGHPLEMFAPEVRAFATANLSRLGELREGVSYSVCGIITEVRERTQKNGRQMAFFTIEDYFGQAEIAVFGQQYEQLREFIRVDELVMVRGAPSTQSGQLRWKIHDILPMQRVRDQLVRSIILKVDTTRVAADDMKELLDLCERNRGSCKLYFDIEDEDLGERVRLRSRTFVVDPSPELVQGITRLFGGE